MADHSQAIRETYSIPPENGIVPIDSRYLEVDGATHYRLCAIAANIAQHLGIAPEPFIEALEKRHEDFYLVDETDMLVMVLTVLDHTDYIMLPAGSWRFRPSWG